MHERKVITVENNTPEAEAQWDKAEATSLLGSRFILVGPAKTPGQDMWNLWVSLTGHDVRVIAAYPTPQQVATSIRLVQDVIALLVPFDGEKLAVVLNALTDESPLEPKPLPESVVKQLAIQIEKFLVRMN